jgi:hypothetical protein
MIVVSALAFLAVCASSFDLKRGILGEWELFNLTDPSFPAYTVEFHRAAKSESIVGSFWLNDPGKSDLDDSLSPLLELAFTSPSDGLVMLAAPRQSKFATFNVSAREGCWPIELSGTFSGHFRYLVELANLTNGVLSIEGAAAFDLQRVPDQATSSRWGAFSSYAVLALAGVMLLFCRWQVGRPRRRTRTEMEKRARQKKDDDAGLKSATTEVVRRDRRMITCGDLVAVQEEKIGTGNENHQSPEIRQMRDRAANQ